jgi:hypothetical protein
MKSKKFHKIVKKMQHTVNRTKRAMVARACHRTGAIEQIAWPAIHRPYVRTVDWL